MYNVRCRTIVNLFILMYAYGWNDYCAQLQIPEEKSKYGSSKIRSKITSHSLGFRAVLPVCLI